MTDQTFQPDTPTETAAAVDAATRHQSGNHPVSSEASGSKDLPESLDAGSEPPTEAFNGLLELAGRIAELEAKLKEAEEAKLRTLAEMDNQRRRLARERDDIRRTAAAALIEDLLPALDNLQMGLAIAAQHPEAAPVVQGFTFVVQQIETTLGNHNLEKLVPAPGSTFDPNLHEAVGEEDSATAAEGTISRCQRSGYQLNGRLLRAAMVILSRGAAAPDGGPPPATAEA